jgi:4a-hydroxytetrahydrobiopterin dehydratase
MLRGEEIAEAKLTEGTDNVVESVAQQDVDPARRITEVAADHELEADPASVSMIELGLDTGRSATLAPLWAALLTGNADSQGRGTPSDEIRDDTGPDAPSLTVIADQEGNRGVLCVAEPAATRG